MVKRIKNLLKFCFVISFYWSKISLRKRSLKFSGGTYYFSRFSRLYNYWAGIDRRISDVFLSYGLYEEIIHEIRELTILDIGANIGEFSIYLRAIEGHLGKIYCFEPDPFEYKTLKKNAVRFNLDTVNKAISDEDKERRFISKNEDADSRLLLQTEGEENSIEVNCTTLNNFCDEYGIEEIGLLKIEAEGFEPEVLKGINFSEIKIKYICIDCGPERPPSNDATLVSCLNQLIEAGYSLIAYNPHRHSIVCQK